MPSGSHRVRFGVFELDLVSSEIRKAGRRVRLAGQPVRILETLVSRAGQLVSREDLQKGLWSDDSLVDAERNLNSAIKRLRAALGDSADVPRYIETLPRRGYRFIAAVEWVVEPEAAALVPPQPAAHPALQDAIALAPSSSLASAAGDQVVSPSGEPLARSGNGLSGFPVRLPALGAAAALAAIALAVFCYWGWVARLAQDPNLDARGASGSIARRVPPSDRRIYEVYTQGRYHLAKGTERDQLKAVTFFQEALALDGSHAPSHSGLADYYLLTDALAPAVALPLAREHARTALALDETLADAHVSLAYVHYYGDWNWRAAERHFTRALELDPSHVRGHRWYGLFLASMSRFDEARAQIDRAVRLDPISMPNYDAAASIRFAARDYDGALVFARRLLDLDPRDPRGYENQSIALMQKGLVDAALAIADKGLTVSGRSPALEAIRAMCLGRLGRTHEAATLLERLAREDIHGYVPAVFFAIAAADLGQHTTALAHLEEAYRNRDPYMVTTNVTPWFDALRSNPRFQRVVSDLKFPGPD